MGEMDRLEPIEKASQDELHALQLGRLKTTLSEAYERIPDYRARFGDYWQPAPLVERLVASGRGFHGPDRVAA